MSELENAEIKSSAENERGDFLGTLHSGEQVYDRVDSHLADHSDTAVLLAEVFARIDWNQDTPEDKYVPFMVEFAGRDFGPSGVAAVPDREGVRVVWAPRVNADGVPIRFRPAEYGPKAPLYSPWVIGLTEEEIPPCDKVKVVLTKPANQVSESTSLKLITAFTTAYDAPREAGENFSSFGTPEDQKRSRDAAKLFWLGRDADGNQVNNGHAFVYDPENPAFDLATALDACPYEL